MTHPIPPGTRDILPDEMRELRALQASLCEVFERFGYGEVATPTIEYHDVLAQGDERGAPAAYRFFDERGELLAMRSDMTIPIARLVANRFATVEPPFRFFYIGSAYRAVRPQRGQMREFMQAGVELIGSGATDGTPEVIEVLSAALDAARPDPRGDRPRRRRPLSPAPRRAGGHGGGAPTRSPTDSRRTTWSASRRRSRRCEIGARSGRRCCAWRTCAAGRRYSTRPASWAATPSSAPPAG